MKTTRQQTDINNALSQLWWKPGSTTVGHGFVVTNPSVRSDRVKVHHTSQCQTVWSEDLKTETVFSHPSIGEYTLGPDGTRLKFAGWCSLCDPARALRPKARPNKKRWEASQARKAAVAASRAAR